ncbi:MAG: type II toxin-antitoxin system MqsR family toxin [Candidatus Eisenbacteria bacterium]|uniref:Type II toxin-antitoxin system MqsR family toxin n=1 Tax=Eiseniibacteriota bacterium TaxID=2212470 RepID=A0A933SDR4_UNCEI|nr:type II toxin-antitoxin system MqsR family toxin [Candidatus Eisenbacteria bacterium]
MTERDGPSYDLLEVQYLVRRGRVATTVEVQRTMTRDELSVADLIATLLRLTEVDFHKSMLSERDGRSMLDVYRPFLVKARIYLKFKLTPDRDRVLVLSFKKDTSR